MKYVIIKYTSCCVIEYTWYIYKQMNNWKRNRKTENKKKSVKIWFGQGLRI